MKLLHQFSFLGQFPDEKYADLRLTTPEEATKGVKRVLLAHKVVLAAVSEKIEALIDLTKDKDCVQVRNIRFEILGKIVKFIYTGSVNVSEGDEEDDFLDGLDMLRIKVTVSKDEDNSVASGSPPVSSGELVIADQDTADDGNTAENSGANLSSTLVSQRNVVENPSRHFNGLFKDSEFSMESTDSLQNVDGEEEQNNNVTGGSSQGNNSVIAGNIVVRTKSVSINLPKIDINQWTVASSVEEEDADSCKSFKTCHKFVGSAATGKSCEARIQVAPRKTLIKGSIMGGKTFEVGNGGNDRNRNDDSKKNSGTQVIKCEYCDWKIRLDNYPRHCRRLHREEFEGQEMKACEFCGHQMFEVCLRKLTEVFHSSVSRGKTNQIQENQRTPVTGTEKTKAKCPLDINCEFCEAMVQSRSYARHCRNRHPEVLEGQKRIPCRFCGNKLCVPLLKKHTEACHPESISTAETDMIKKKVRQVINCEFCDGMLQLKRYAVHCRNRHPEVLKGQKRIPCCFCGRKLYEPLLKKHKESCHPKRNVLIKIK